MGSYKSNQIYKPTFCDFGILNQPDLCLRISERPMWWTSSKDTVLVRQRFCWSHNGAVDISRQFIARPFPPGKVTPKGSLVRVYYPKLAETFRSRIYNELPAYWRIHLVVGSKEMVGARLLRGMLLFFFFIAVWSSNIFQKYLVRRCLGHPPKAELPKTYSEVVLKSRLFGCPVGR